MKKDYLPIKNHQLNEDEITFVERFWTEKWDGRNINPESISFIKSAEEFPGLHKHLSVLPKDANVLDGGCGMGLWTIYLRNQGYNAIGVDISKKTIKNIKKVTGQDFFSVEDIRKTTFLDDFFHMYFSWGTFEHFEDGLGSCLKEAHRILKPGGKLIISVPFQNRRHTRISQKDLVHWDDGYEANRGYKQPMRFYQWRLTIPELKREFEINGFTCQEIHPIHKSDGLSRMINHDLKLPYGTRFHRIAHRILSPFIPKSWVSHMILGVGIKKPWHFV